MIASICCICSHGKHECDITQRRKICLLSQCLTERCNVLVGTAHLESKLKW